MRIKSMFAALSIAALCLMVSPARAQTQDVSAFPKDEFMLGRVDAVLERGEKDFGGYTEPYQRTRVTVTTGPEKGRVIEQEHAGTYNDVDVGDRVIVTKVTVEGESRYYIADEFRLPAIGMILLMFFAVAAFFGGWRGVSAFFGLAFSLLVLGAYIVPRIAEGGDPVVITISGACVIMVASLYLAHGFNRRTSLALASTAVTLAIAVGIATLFVSLTKLLGIGSDEASLLQLGPLGPEKMRGLLLGGIIIGTLGVLDDITTAQTATVEEIAKADPRLGPAELYKRGLSVGREHIASLVNTLALAYAGASLPLFLLFALEHAQPFWVLMNGESVAQEVVRTLVGSSALIFAVPISTGLAAYVFGKKLVAPAAHGDTGHHHHSH